MNKYFFVYFILMNFLGFSLMYIDKEKAKKNKWRIQEKTLLLIAVLGGSIGSYLGMKKFRHKTRHAKFKYGIPLIIVIQLIVFLYLGNNIISVSQYKIENSKLPNNFNNFKIVQISDLHNKVFPINNKQLIWIIKKQKPDAIFITGDLIDRRKYNEEKALRLIEQIKTIAPIYYVTGNHEAWSENFSSLENSLEENGVVVLRNNFASIKKGQDEIFISGIDDPGFNTEGYREDYKDYNIVKEEIEKIKKEDYYNILLAHRPEHFPLYVDEKIDLVFSGHAHGGQVILPLLGGIVAPNQGFFPSYFQGIYNENNTSMVVSRGLGNSIAPLRIFNPPELVVAILQAKSNN